MHFCFNTVDEIKLVKKANPPQNSFKVYIFILKVTTTKPSNSHNRP